MLVGSGVTEDNIGAYLEWADGVIRGNEPERGLAWYPIRSMWKG